MLDLYKLTVFLAAAQAGSFSAAAESLYITQSAVSQHIHDLESALGTRLFERQARGVRLTAAGETLADYARRVVQLLAEAENALTNVEQLSSGQLRLGATPGAGVYLLPDWIQAFYGRYPRLRVALSTDVTAAIAAGLRRRALDLGVIEGELAADAGLASVVLQEVAQWVVLRADHPLAAADTLPLAALHGQAFIMRPPGSHTRLWLDALLKAHDVRVVVTAEFDAPEAIKQAVIGGLGLSILPEYVFRRERAAGLLRALPVTDVPLTRALRLLWARQQPFNPITRAFLRLLARSFPPLHEILE
ncbi:MAG: LysR family transcriptional regulator [Chloroflexi bacterium]|nr:LysR family transcriptional regulator [Chloroflexota bacterium]